MTISIQQVLKSTKWKELKNISNPSINYQIHKPIIEKLQYQ
jgi:hypothetical protein